MNTKIKKYRRDVVNLKRGTKTADKRTLQFGKGFADDLEAGQLLTEKGWLFEEYQVVDAKKELRWGLVFANPKQLLILQRRASVEQLHQQLYAIHVMDQLNLEEDTRNSRVEAWMGHVQTTLSSLTDVRPEDIARNRPWEL